MKCKTLLLCVTLAFPTFLLGQRLETLPQKHGVSFRGIATHNNEVWVSGTSGTIGKSIDGGMHWTWLTPAGYETFDFRDIAVFSDKEALVMSAGSPAVILRTEDGGTSWNEVYRDGRPEAFLDGMDFNGRQGFVVGDPTTEGTFQLLQTNDKGKTWKDVTDFMFLIADDGEVAFAASGTSIRYLHRNVWLGTGGTTANVFRRNEKERRVDKLPCPMLQGRSSRGIFSLDFWSDKVGIAVGGDYMDDRIKENTILLTSDGGKNWQSPENEGSGFKSCVRYIDRNTVVATGTSGTDISYNGGRVWEPLSAEGFHTLAVDKNKKRVFMAGSDGRISVFVMQTTPTKGK